jgi:long-subunit acyl-CoA synthetase (AMP-forming)
MESTTITPAQERAVDAPTVTEALRRTAASHPDLVAVRTADDAVSLTWSELLTRVDAFAGGLAGLGVGRGDTVAIMLGNRPEFYVADLAAVTVGATPFSIYVTYPPAEIEFLCRDAGARVAITEQAYLPAILAAREHLPALEHVIVVDGEAPEGTLQLSEVEGANPGFDAVAAAAQTGPEDIVTLIYTSGTTGHPKGVQLTHHAIMFSAQGVEQMVPLVPGSKVISWLPAAHIAERMAHLYIPVIYAGTVTTCPDPRAILSYLPQVRPTWFFAVPRIWEKLKAGLETMQAAQAAEQRKPIEDAMAASLQRVRLRQAGAPVPAELEQAVAQADETLFCKLREMLGLDQVVAVNVGAAPTPREVLEFFHALGIELAEIWGMSETCGIGAANRPGQVKLGTVGPASPGVELRIADDGELLVRGEFVMAGYRNSPEKTAEALDSDGWLHTGDIGEIDDDGYLRIVDRKKEIIINSAGKNMSPANIEAEIKSASPLIGQAICIGDQRKYNTALIVLDADFAPQWAQQQGVADTGLERLAAEPTVVAAIQEAIDAANEHLARVEQIKKFTIVPGDWLPGGDELTPTMKLKRRPIAAKYEAEIDRMYAD